jgi:hypothetical protein
VTSLVCDGASSRSIVSPCGQLFLPAASRELFDLRVYSLEPIHPIFDFAHYRMRKNALEFPGVDNSENIIKIHKMFPSGLQHVNLSRVAGMKQTACKYEVQ